MSYAFGGRIDDDSYAVTYIDEDQGTAVTKGEINGVPFEGGGGSSDFSTAMMSFDGENYTVTLHVLAPFYDSGYIYNEADAMSGDGPYEFVIGSNGTTVYINHISDDATITVSGNATDVGNNYYTATGDFTFTIS